MKKKPRHMKVQKEKTNFASWEDARILQLKALSRSYNKIAEELGRSRNSIIGRWHRVLKKETTV